jgi:hypothetical protein
VCGGAACFVGAGVASLRACCRHSQGQGPSREQEAEEPPTRQRQERSRLLRIGRRDGVEGEDDDGMISLVVVVVVVATPGVGVTAAPRFVEDPGTRTATATTTVEIETTVTNEEGGAAAPKTRTTTTVSYDADGCQIVERTVEPL